LFTIDDKTDWNVENIIKEKSYLCAVLRMIDMKETKKKTKEENEVVSLSSHHKMQPVLQIHHIPNSI